MLGDLETPRSRPVGGFGMDAARGVEFSEVVVGGDVDVDRSLPKSADFSLLSATARYANTSNFYGANALHPYPVKTKV